jgi:hypothetical protein
LGEDKNTHLKIQGIIMDYFENLYSNKLENLEEMDTFLDTYDHLKLNQEGINHLNRYITCNETEAAIKSLPKRKNPGPDEFSAELYQNFKELTLTVLKLFHEIQMEEHYLTHSIKPALHSPQNWTKTHPKRRTQANLLNEH